MGREHTASGIEGTVVQFRSANPERPVQPRSLEVLRKEYEGLLAENKKRSDAVQEVRLRFEEVAHEAETLRTLLNSHNLFKTLLTWEDIPNVPVAKVHRIADHYPKENTPPPGIRSGEVVALSSKGHTPRSPEERIVHYIEERLPVLESEGQALDAELQRRATSFHDHSVLLVQKGEVIRQLQLNEEDGEVPGQNA